MTRIIAPDKGVKQTEIGNRTYTVNRQGVSEVNNSAHVKAMKAEGYFEASLNPYNAGDQERGYTCTECGFGSWFMKCGRCGHENIKAIRTDGD
jgi:DNA-directed RNA polymerase subunit RPC12/RpoP